MRLHDFLMGRDGTERVGKSVGNKIGKIVRKSVGNNVVGKTARGCGRECLTWFCLSHRSRSAGITHLHNFLANHVLCVRRGCVGFFFLFISSWRLTAHVLPQPFHFLFFKNHVKKTPFRVCFKKNVGKDNKIKGLRPFLVQSDSASRKRPILAGLFFDWILLVLLIVSRVDFIVFVLSLERGGWCEGVLLYSRRNRLAALCFALSPRVTARRTFVPASWWLWA